MTNDYDYIMSWSELNSYKDEIREVQLNVQKDKKIEESAKALEDIFDNIKEYGIEYEKAITRPTERSMDTWGLRNKGDEYGSDFSIDIIEDESGERKIKVYE